LAPCSQDTLTSSSLSLPFPSESNQPILFVFCLVSHSPSSSSSAGVEGRGLFSSLASEISDGSFRFTWGLGKKWGPFQNQTQFPTTTIQGRLLPFNTPLSKNIHLGTLNEGSRRAPRSPDPKAKASIPVVPPLLAQSTRDSIPGSLSFVFSLSSSLACCLAAFWNGYRQQGTEPQNPGIP
jgi:hypothetical protein